MCLISVVLAFSVLAVIVFGYFNRRGTTKDDTKGIGWQFIRYTVLAIALPIVGILALNDALSGEAATLIAGAMGYAFAKTDDK